MANNDPERHDLVLAVKRVIDRHDPLSLRAHGAPDNEFRPQAEKIVVARSRCRDVESCLTLVWDVFKASYGDSIGPRSYFVPIADEVFAILWPDKP
jgi:hypothetical protein